MKISPNRRIGYAARSPATNPQPNDLLTEVVSELLRFLDGWARAVPWPPTSRDNRQNIDHGQPAQPAAFPAPHCARSKLLRVVGAPRATR
ncbi:hypothetical protein [Nocardia sp. NPDC058633]|uniref:hypothetical protein n=1 Tax=Nocardia sp. NPDC058633 TaxID=3346568 RepID=UPI00364E66DC